MFESLEQFQIKEILLQSSYFVAQLADMAGSCRIVVMASGNGSNFQALVDAVKAQRISNSQIVRLIVNRKKAYAVTRAENMGIPCTYFNMISEGFQAKEETDPEKLKEGRSKYDAALAELVLQDTVDLVILAGWLHVFTYASNINLHVGGRSGPLTITTALRFCEQCESIAYL